MVYYYQVSENLSMIREELPEDTNPDKLSGYKLDDKEIILSKKRGPGFKFNNPSYFNIVYFANREWHPQLYGETLFFSNDNVSGDYAGKFSNDQGRGYPIGEAENVVTPLPGRFMFYDQRYLHSVKPIAHYSPEKLMGVVFRTRLLPEGDTNETN